MDLFVRVKTSVQPLLLRQLATAGLSKATPGFDYAHLYVGPGGRKRLFCFNIRIVSLKEASIKKIKKKESKNNNHIFQMSSTQFLIVCSFLLQVIIGDRAEYKTHMK